ncbi:MAG: glycosyltransferase family 1 protein [Anaerolineae bacterium]
MSEDNAGALRVGVNAHLLSLGETYRSAGINWYIHNLLRHLPGADPEIACTAFLGEKRFSRVPGLELAISQLPTHRPPVRIAWEQAVQPWAARRAGVDLIHAPAFVGPLAGAPPFVVTIHDLSFLLYPERFRAGNRRYLRLFTRLSVGRARRVIAVSQSTRDDVVRLYGLAPDRVDVVHNGVDGAYRPLPPGEVAAFRARQNLPERFILFVGTLEPRKNVTGLVEAYARLPLPRPPLMLVGGKGWLYDEVYARVEQLGLGSEVHFVGFVDSGELPWWYNAAEVFVYPSFYEGFGLPALEAMACGTPVIASDTSSLPEVVGAAGVLVDPEDPEALAATLDRVLTDSTLAGALQAAGPQQAARFSWQRAARETAASYRRALNGGGGA